MQFSNMRFLAVLLSLAVGYEGVMAESPRSNLRNETKALGDEPEVTETSTKGSLLVFPKIELRWAESGPGEWDLVQDTFIELTNDFPEDLTVQMHYVDGDQPSMSVDVATHLTANEPTYWSAATGLPKGVSPFFILHPGFPPGRLCNDGSGERCLRGYVLAWAMDEHGQQIAWNHLTGSTVILHYEEHRAWEHPPWAFQCVGAPRGEPCGSTAGELSLDGTAYEFPPDELLFEFYAVGADPFDSDPDPGDLPVDTDLTLLPLMVDLRQDGSGPVMTKAKFDVWNMNEWKFSGTHRCIFGWDQTLLSQYDPPNHLLLVNLMTDKGKARIDGLESQVCPESSNAPLLGVSARLLTYTGGTSSMAGSALTGIGVEPGLIVYDPWPGIPAKRTATSDTRILRSGEKRVVRARDDDHIQRDREPEALQDQVHRVSTSRKGSLLIFPKVEVRWDASGNLVQDTFIELSNNYPEDVNVLLYLVVGDVDNVWGSSRIQLTSNEPAYWSMLTGAPKGVISFSNFIPFRSPDDDPLNPGGFRLRGYLLAWAVNNVGAGQEIRWNHLSGKATLVNTGTKTSWEYRPYSFRALDQGGSVHQGDQTGTPLVLNLDGEEYDECFDMLLLDFFATDSDALSGSMGQDVIVRTDTDLTLLPVDIDLRTSGNTGPTTTKATFQIWNMNEWMFSGTHRCVTGWDQSFLSDYDDPNHFLLENIQADKGKARIDGNASMICPESEDAPLVGVEMRLLTFGTGPIFWLSWAATGRSLVGMGVEPGIIIVGCGSDADCDDGDPCTGDICDSASGSCVYEFFNCDDSDPCTIDTCTWVGDPPVMICAYEPVDCDDGDPCTDDRCVAVGSDPPVAQCENVPVGCRMTGGGSVFLDRVRFTHGFELHCDPNDGPNRLQINWSGGQRFHLTSLDVAYCMDDSNINEAPPDARFDTLVGSGTGRLNGVPGATITFKFIDAGEPGGGGDYAEFTINGTAAITVSGPLSKGNHQAHSE